MQTLEGMLSAKNMKIAIVVARFNEFITSNQSRQQRSRRGDGGNGNGKPAERNLNGLMSLVKKFCK